MKKRFKLWDAIEGVIDFLTAAGVVTSVYWVYTFLTAPSEITVSNMGITIKGIAIASHNRQNRH
jgi:hypothetical protein